MIRIIIDVEAPSGQAIGVKEDIAMYLERYGDCKVVDVIESLPEQMKIGGKYDSV